MYRWFREEGSSLPLGATCFKELDSFNFALYSKHATQVSLLFYSDEDFTNPLFSYDFDPYKNKTHRIWHCRLPAAQLSGVRFYAYRIDGPEATGRFEWHTFDPEKILLDPYARGVFFPPAYSRQAAIAAGPNDGKAPLGYLPTAGKTFDWHDDSIRKHGADLIIYELHVRGFTQHQSSGVPKAKRGTFAGIVEKIPYLQELGITAVELMPIHQQDPQSHEYWGYNTLNFFSINNQYAEADEAGQQISEFKTMVHELHRAGIEVILDVVYNHTCEGDDRGPTFSFKGIDNSTYYLINQDLDKPYFNFSGTGNTMHTANLAVKNLIIDSLRYWAEEMHIDGFRFDLASVFARDQNGDIAFDRPPIFGDIRTHRALAGVRLIAEPWDTAIDQLGTRFPGAYWKQWNGAFRDDVRRFVRGDEGMVGAFMQRLYGSDDLFPGDPMNAYHAHQSVNFINAHDGFTLYDLVAYNEKHNEANGLHNTDGTDQNYSWNCGFEGDQDVPAEVIELRLRQARNFFTILMISNGTPMFTMGDEFLRSQGGNNNPFNQDNETSWVDWRRQTENRDFFNFCKKMIAFRKAHPSLCRSRFWRGDIRWYGADGPVNMGPGSHLLAFYLDGSAEEDDDIYAMFNAHWEGHTFRFGEKGPWHRIVNTGILAPQTVAERGQDIIKQDNYWLGPRSVAVFVRSRQ